MALARRVVRLVVGRLPEARLVPNGELHDPRVARVPSDPDRPEFARLNGWADDIELFAAIGEIDIDDIYETL